MNDFCPHCHAKTVTYHHRLNKGIVGALVSLYRASGTTPAKKSSLSLTTVQYANFQKLRYWNLVARAEGSMWYVTEKGKDFLLGGYAKKSVWTYRGTPCAPPDGFETSFVRLNELLPGYTYRKQYAEEAAGQGVML